MILMSFSLGLQTVDPILAQPLENLVVAKDSPPFKGFYDAQKTN